MIDRQIRPRVGLTLRAAGLLGVACATLWLGPAGAGAKPSATRATARRSTAVVACLRRGHLRDVTTSASYLWVGWDAKVGGFVYVEKYPTSKAARAQAEFLADEESGLAGNLVVSQHIAPYKGSPVPAVVKCLGGIMVSKKPTGGGVYKF